MARVILGVGAGIAAYKACELLRLLKESGHAVRVIPTRDALRFVGEPTWAALSGEPVATDVWAGVSDVPHVKLGQTADLVIVAPATADLLARATAGLSNDLLTATLLTARCPVVYAPAMHTEMWEHPATRHNVATLRGRGAIVIEPAVGRLTGKDTGKGRLPEPADLFELAEAVIASPTRAAGPLAGKRVLISAGGTREELDPVRFLGNWSTGRQGYAFASAAVFQGADVTLVAANVELPDPAGAKVIRVVSARDMHAAMLAEAAQADAIIMTAAVADFRPAARADQKIKKDGTLPPPIELTENPDILAALVQGPRAPRAGRPGDRRLRRGNQPRPGRGPRQTGPQGLRPLGRQPGRQRPGLRRHRQRVARARRGRHRDGHHPPFEGRPGRRRAGPRIGPSCLTGGVLRHSSPRAPHLRDRSQTPVKLNRAS